MRITSLILHTSQLEAQHQFFSQTLGFPCTNITEGSFSLQLGWTSLIFKKSTRAYRYHYCFLIPANQLEAGISWLQARLKVYEIEPGRLIQHFDSWNADSAYFYDGAGNLAEIIVRHDLQNASHRPFELSSFLCVNEIGMPVTDIVSINQQLSRELGSSFWKGNQTRFGTHGDQEGLFLLPNPLLKDNWFPANLPIEDSPFSAVVQTLKGSFELIFQEGQLEIATSL